MNQYIQETAKSIPVVKETDVVVAGGGLSGVIAAYAAARSGADTMLIERFSCLGGVAVMGLPITILGAMLGCWVMGEPVSIYTQIGIVLLIALSAKNGILIVEFARDYRKAGNSIREAAFEAGRVRLRPILMTSFTFVLGVMPLLFATGAGAGSRVALGAAVVFGMLVNTVVATLYIPNWYEVMQTLEEKKK